MVRKERECSINSFSKKKLAEKIVKLSGHFCSRKKQSTVMNLQEGNSKRVLTFLPSYKQSSNAFAKDCS